MTPSPSISSTRPHSRPTRRRDRKGDYSTSSTIPVAGVVFAAFLAASIFFANASRSRRARSVARFTLAASSARSFRSRLCFVTSRSVHQAARVLAARRATSYVSPFRHAGHDPNPHPG